MGLNQAWVDEVSAWLRTSQPSVGDQIARARDQLRQQWLAEEQERRAEQLSRSQAAPASLIGPLQVMKNSPSQQTTSAQKRKLPDWNSYSNLYENTYQAQRQRVDMQGAFVNTSSQAPPMAVHSPRNITPHMSDGQVPTFHQRGQSRDTVPTPPTVPTSNQNANAHMIHSHGQLPRINGPQFSQRPPMMSSPSTPSTLTPTATIPASAPAPAPSSSPRPSNTQSQERLLAEAPNAPPSARLGSLSNPHTSSITIRQEVAHPSRDHVSTLTLPPRSETSPECSSIEVPGGNVRNSRSTTTEAGSRGSPSGSVEGASNPRSRISPGVDITEQTEPVTKYDRDGHSAREGEVSDQASPVDEVTPPNLRENSTISPSDVHEDASQVHTPINTTTPADPARELTKTPHVHGRKETSTSEETTTRNDHHVVTDTARSPGTSSTTARASPASVQPESPLIVPLSRRQSCEPTAVDDPVCPHNHDSGSRDDHTKAGSHSPHQSPSTAPKDIPGRDLPTVRQVDTTGSRASSSSLSSPISLSAFSPRQSPVFDRTSRQKSRSPVVPPKSPEAPHVESRSRRPSIESSRPRQDSTPATVSHASKSAVVEPSNEKTRRTDFPVDCHRPSAISATSPVGTDAGESRQSHSPKQAPVNVWADRRRQSQPASPRVPRTQVVESGPSTSQPTADYRRRRLSKIWPQADLTKYEGLGEDLVYLAGKRIPEDIVQAHLNAEALYRMEKKSRNQGDNLSGDPHPTQRDCTQAKARHEKWQDQNPGMASKQFPPPNQDELLKLMRKFGVEVSKNGFLDYHGEQTQASNGTDRESLAPGRKLTWPDWYSKIKQQQLQTMVRGGGGNIGVDAKLGKFKALVRRCAETQEKDRGSLFDDIRKELHQLVFVEVNEIAVRRAQMLHKETGLPQIFAVEFSKGVNYPWDLQADAFELYNRWCTRTFSVDPLRGIIRSSKNNRATDRFKPGFTGKSGAAYHGQGDLVNGQWWPTQLCTVRDGAHGSTQGGIYAVKGKPAFSVIVSGGSQYNDRDEGTELWYSGTYTGVHPSASGGSGSKYSDNTQSLILSVEEKKPVRVIRSHNMHKRDGRFRPLRGFRYDGLYDVVGYDVVNEAQGGCLFHMVRRPGQDPIRADGVSMRPTGKEIAEYDKIKKFL